MWKKFLFVFPSPCSAHILPPCCSSANSPSCAAVTCRKRYWDTLILCSSGFPTECGGIKDVHKLGRPMRSYFEIKRKNKSAKNHPNIWSVTSSEKVRRLRDCTALLLDKMEKQVAKFSFAKRRLLLRVQTPTLRTATQERRTRRYWGVDDELDMPKIPGIKVQTLGTKCNALLILLIACLVVFTGQEIDR